MSSSIREALSEAGVRPEPDYSAWFRPQRVPRIIPLDAGWTPDPRNEADLRSRLEADDRKQWEGELRRRLHAVIEMFDTDDESEMDLMQLADGQCRMFDNIMSKKKDRALDLKAVMDGIERDGRNQREFDETAWMRADEQLKRLRRSWRKFSYGFKVALVVRHMIAGQTGSRWGEYRSADDFKAARAQANKLRLATVDASKMVGMEEKNFRFWQAFRLAYEPELDGVDAQPDLPGGALAEQKALKDRQHQQTLAARGADGKYLRRRPRAVPKEDVSIVPSGEPGSRHRALTAEVRKTGSEG